MTAEWQRNDSRMTDIRKITLIRCHCAVIPLYVFAVWLSNKNLTYLQFHLRLPHSMKFMTLRPEICEKYFLTFPQKIYKLRQLKSFWPHYESFTCTTYHASWTLLGAKPYFCQLFHHFWTLAQSCVSLEAIFWLQAFLLLSMKYV